jgi:hypothetical protein
MAGLSIANDFDQARLARLPMNRPWRWPWHCPGTAILGALWLFALIPTLGWTDVRRELATPAGGLPDV